MQVCYLRDGDRVFETYWTSGRATEAMAPSYALLDRTEYGRQEIWEGSPPGWPRPFKTTGEQFRTNGRPTAQWPRLVAGRPDDLGTGHMLIRNGPSRPTCGPAADRDSETCGYWLRSEILSNSAM